MDHLIPESQGGLNGLVNRVLACGSCNGDEKLDANWQSFLERKVADSDLHKKRKDVIDKWVNDHGIQQTLSDDMREKIESDFEKVNKIYTDVVQEIRDSREDDRA